MAKPIPDEQAAFLAAIVAEPDEDTPRLVYADWLQEHGDEEQAAFIRYSIKLSQLNDYEDEKRQKMSKRLDEMATTGRRWLEAIGVVGADPIYDRGLAEAVVYADVDAFRRDAPALFARVPLREVTITGLMAETDPDGDSLYPLSVMPELLRLTALHLSNSGWPVTSGGWEQFIASPYLACLQSLSVQHAGLTDDNMSWFERCEHLTHLEELDLSNNYLTAIGALAVVQSPMMPSLRRVSFADNVIVEDRSGGSPYLALRDELIDRFGDTRAMGWFA